MRKWLLSLLDCRLLRARVLNDEVWGAVLECRGAKIGISRGILCAIPRELYRRYRRIKSAYERIPVAPWRATVSEFIRHMRTIHALGLNELSDHLSRNYMVHVLALGCGWGFEVFYLARRLHERGVDFRIVGVDLARKPVEVGRRLSQRLGMLDRVEFMVGVTEWLPFRNGVFDAVTAIYGPLDHTLDPSRAFAEISRVLKRGGFFLATFLNKLSTHSLMWLVRAYRFRKKFLQPEAFVSVAGQRIRTRFWLRSEILSLANRAGFKVKDVWGMFCLVPLKFRRKRMLRIEKILALADYYTCIAPLVRWLGKYVMILFEKVV